MSREEGSAERSDQRDADLIEAVRSAGPFDRAALSELLTRHEDRIFSVCVRMVGDRETARDLAQDAMVKIIEGLDSFDSRAKFTTWLTRVTMNVCISHLRKQRLRRSASLDDALQPAQRGEDAPGFGQPIETREPAASDRVESGEDMTRLSRALAQLDPEQRGIIVLRDAQGMDYRRISETLGVGVGTVKSRLFRARAALREAMERMERGGDASSHQRIEDEPARGINESDQRKQQ